MKNNILRRITGLCMSLIVSMSMSAIPVFSSEKEIAEKMDEDILSVTIPYDISFKVYLSEKAKSSAVISKNFNIENHSKKDVVVIMKTIHYTFNDKENSESSEVPITVDMMEKSGKKLLYMPLNRNL